MKRWTLVMFVLLIFSLTFPALASYAPDEIGTNPNTPPPPSIENLVDWLGGLWQAMVDAFVQDPGSDEIRS